MKRTLTSLLCLAVVSSAQADHPIQLPTISVDGVAGEATPLTLPAVPTAATPDAGELLKQLPGANINRNGPLTSIAQYRGLFGDRVNVLVDGMKISPACPNSMDTPLSYIPATRLDTISLYRGIAPVSSGMETIGGTILARSKKPEFGNSQDFEFHGNARAGYAENGDTYNTSILAGLTNENHRFHLGGSIDRGDDLEFDGGEILPTEHERDTFGGGYAFQNGSQSAALHAEHHDTGVTGTPALPMDIIYAKGDHYTGNFKNTFTNGGEFSAKISYQKADHLMNNYSLRPPHSMMMRRFALTDVKSNGLGIAYAVSGWTFGADADRADHNADVFNPGNPMFFVNTYNNAERNRYSLFTEKKFTAGTWEVEAGLRYTSVKMDADKVTTSMVMAPGMMGANFTTLRDNFNNSDRSQDENLVDVALNFSRPLSSQLDLVAGFARKERAASYQERYLWVPLEATAGLADGNNYIGNVDLDPETAYQIELGFDWHRPRVGFSPHIFYHRINDYIQGTPSTNMVANMLSGMMAPGKPAPLQFNNVDAELYGIDANWFVAVTHNIQLDGTISYVRGERRDTSDNLYRIAPLTARTKISYHQTNWHAGFEAVTVAKQNQISDENHEKKTGGYAIFNLSANYQPTNRITLQAGVNNLFDREYQDHLGGYNRVSNNPNIAKGERLPGLGRSAYIGMNIDW